MLNNVHKAVILGAGGGAGFYVAKFLLLSGIEVTCYDLAKSALTEELESLNAKVIYTNPLDYNFEDYDVIIYTIALAADITSEIHRLNDEDKISTTGIYYKKIVDSFESGVWKENEVILSAIKTSNIAPLFNLDFSECILVGVTGSKGKTTTTTMVYETLNNLGFSVSAVTTIGAKVRGQDIETGLHTSTPSAQELATLFTKMLAAKSKVIVLEVSSHAIATGRIAGLKFDFSIITNLQPEHLDFHKTLENVILTKEKLITTYLKKDGTAILNLDDENIKNIVLPKLEKSPTNVKLITTGDALPNYPCYQIQEIEENATGIDFKLFSTATSKVEDYSLPFPGSFNAYNITPSIIIASELGAKHADIKTGLLNIGVVAGRNEILATTPFKVILDFAHTPESLEAILSTYRTQAVNTKLIVVFGAAGQRDSLKRPRMGVASAKYADITIITAEDPRTENLKDINDQIEAGWDSYVTENKLSQKRTIIRFDDASENVKCRYDAIKKAFDLAEPGDIVLCCGKGPEKSLGFGLIEYEWDEKKTILELLKDQYGSN